MAIRKAREHTQEQIRVKERLGMFSTRFLSPIVGYAAVPALAVALALGACAGSQGTIGAMLGQRADGRLFVREVPEALAAHEMGLAADDEILLIDGKDVRSMDARALHATLSGDVGSPVRLTVVRGEAVMRVTLKRTPPPAPVHPATRRAVGP